MKLIDNQSINDPFQLYTHVIEFKFKNMNTKNDINYDGWELKYFDL